VATSPAHVDAGQRAERHAAEAERLLASRYLTSHVKAQAHATLALYYLGRAQRSTGTD